MLTANRCTSPAYLERLREPTRYKHEQGNRRSRFARAVCAPHNPPPSGGDGKIHFAACVTLFAASALQCIVSVEENPQNCPFSLGFRHRDGEGPSHGHMATCTEQKNWQRTRVWFRRYPGDRQTHRQTYRHTQACSCSSQYFATAAAGEVHNNALL